MKILIAIPTKSTIDAECAIAAANLDTAGHEVVYSYANGRGVYGVAQARNNVALQAIEGGFDYLLSIDSDVMLPANALQLLLDPPDDIVLGCYRYKNDTGDSPFFKINADSGSNKWKFNEMPNDRFEVRQAGLGCALISTDVFRKLEKPFFHWDERPSGCHTGEDIWFCDRARKAGFKIIADGRVKCRHAGRKVYG